MTVVSMFIGTVCRKVQQDQDCQNWKQRKCFVSFCMLVGVDSLLETYRWTKLR